MVHFRFGRIRLPDTCESALINYSLTGLLVPYREILSPRFLRTDLASSVRTSKPRALQYFTVRPLYPVNK